MQEKIVKGVSALINNGKVTETYYKYGVHGNLTAVTDAENHTKTYSYSDAYSHAYLTSITDALGNTLSLLTIFLQQW
jgi:YD repeat-containing protein